MGAHRSLGDASGGGEEGEEKPKRAEMARHLFAIRGTGDRRLIAERLAGAADATMLIVWAGRRAVDHGRASVDGRGPAEQVHAAAGGGAAEVALIAADFTDRAVLGPAANADAGVLDARCVRGSGVLTTVVAADRSLHRTAQHHDQDAERRLKNEAPGGAPRKAEMRVHGGGNGRWENADTMERGRLTLSV